MRRFAPFMRRNARGGNGAARAPVPTDVWIAIGDSMTDGYSNPASLPPGYPPLDGTLWMRRKLSYGGGYEQLTEPCGEGKSATQAVGPWGMFAWLVQQETGRHTCMINGGLGGRKTSDYLPPTVAYADLVERCDSVLSRPMTTLRGLCMYHGPNDALQLTPPSWLANVQTILAAIRTRYGVTAAQCPLVFSDLTVYVPTHMTFRWWDATTAAAAGGGANVRDDMTALEDANHIKITPPSPPAGDQVHHDTAQNYTIAQTALAAVMTHPSWA